MKKLLTLVAALGLAMSSWAMTPERTTTATQPQAKLVLLVVDKGFDHFGYRRSGFWYDLTQAVGQAAGATAGGLLGAHVAGPVGAVVGAGVGAA